MVLQEEVSAHEPWLALDGGNGTGSRDLIHVCEASVSMLSTGGFIALETSGERHSHICHARMTSRSAI